MNDLISRQAAIDALYDWSEHSMTDAEAWHIRQVIGDIKSMPSAQPIDVQEAYYRGKIDGIKECTAKLKKMNKEFHTS
jgi:hypothetical protein